MIKAKTSPHRGRKTEALAEVCSVRVEKTLYGVPISHILEIVGSARPQPVPLAPAYIGGLVHYRGDVLTTVSLRQLLGLPPKEGPQDILVLECAGGCFGLLVDSVGEVLAVSTADYESNPSILEERRRSLLAGAYKLKSGLLVMLDPDRLDPLRLAAAQSGPAQAARNSPAQAAYGLPTRLETLREVRSPGGKYASTDCRRLPFCEGFFARPARGKGHRVRRSNRWSRRT
jgi:purine-binding chemotaxis protein CheW